MRFENIDFQNLEQVVEYAEYLAKTYKTIQYVVKYVNYSCYSITPFPHEAGITIFWSSHKGYWGIGKLG